MKRLITICLISLLILVSFVSAAITSTFCESAGSHSVDCPTGCGDCAVTCTNPTYQTNDCWEQWTVYCITCSDPGDNYDVTFYANSSWTSDSNLADTCNFGNACFSSSNSCGGSDWIWAYSFWGYCGLADYGTLEGNVRVVDTGTFAGTSTASDTEAIAVKTEEWSTMPDAGEIYKTSVMKEVAAITQPYGYYTAQQLKMYYKGTTAYPDTYASHKIDTWDDVCTGGGTVCEALVDWDDYSELSSDAEDAFDDNKCSISCGAKSVATIQSTLRNGFPIIVKVDGSDLELEASGDTSLSTSWGIGDYAEYDGNLLVVGNDSSGYYVYHPYNQKQKYSYATFNNFYDGLACTFSCDIDSILGASAISVWSYDTVTLMPSGAYETGGIFDPFCGCWDYNGDGDYEDIGDECRHANVESGQDCCDDCPDVGVVYSGTEVTSSAWNAQVTMQENSSETIDIAFTAVASGNTDDRSAVFAETDITITWNNPTITGDIQYAAGGYDDDENDDGNLVKTYTIGFNASGSSSNGGNNYTNIWGAIWNIMFTTSGVVDKSYCVSNYTNTGQEVVDPESWCTSVCASCTFNDSEWTKIINHSYPLKANFTATVRLVTVNYGPSAGIGWSGTASINFSYTDSSLIPAFDSVVVNGINITDWNPPLTDPIIFNMNNTIFDEDYIQWMAVDYDDDDDTDRCYSRDLAYSLHCENNATFLDADFSGYWSDNQTSADNIQLFSITITADSLADANVNKNVSIQMATRLNISGWVKQEYQFQSATLIAELNLVDSDTDTWDTDYGDTIWYNLNDTQFNRYNSSFINIEEVNISAVDCYDNVLIKALCTVLGFLQLPDSWCYCVVESVTRRDWNHSPILGVCYDYTDDGTYDKCFSSHTADENYWTGFSMEDADKCDIGCDYTEHPETENWYLNYSLPGVGTGSGILEGYMCNIYENCDNDLQAYSFEAPNYIANCSIVENINTKVTYRLTGPTFHTERASVLAGTPVTIRVSGSTYGNNYFPNLYTMVMYETSNETTDYLIEALRTKAYTPQYVFCNAADLSDCSNPCDFFGTGDICDDLTITSWSTDINYTAYKTNAVHFLVIIGYDFDFYDNIYYAVTSCDVMWSGPDIEGCILPSPYDEDLDDDFKVFMNSTTVNVTIGFDPNCSTIVPRNEKYVTDFSISGINDSFTGAIHSNITDIDITFNTTGLTNEVTGVCWDNNEDGVWDAYAGYVNCLDPGVEGGGSYVNITTACPNATINWSANWYTPYNITRNDTNQTTVKVQVFDKCGATVVNATQVAYWDRGTLLCSNRVRDDENNELIGSGSTSISDYGGTCGLCTDHVLNNDESKTSYYDTGYDYGGKWCGYCDLDETKDEIWIEVVKEYGLVAPFDTGLCDEIRGVITIAGIIMMIIMLILLVGLLFLLLLVGIPLIIMVTKGVVFTVEFIRRLRGLAKKRKVGRKLLQALHRVKRGKC